MVAKGTQMPASDSSASTGRFRRMTSRAVVLADGTASVASGRPNGCGCEDSRTLVGHGHGVLEVRRQRAVCRSDRPLVVAYDDFVAAGGDHRLDCQRHPGREGGAAARLSVVGDLRVLVHVTADAVADEAPDD